MSQENITTFPQVPEQKQVNVASSKSVDTLHSFSHSSLVIVSDTGLSN